ncbi:MAG: hypothetical protein PVI90_00040 [Desulfobacteraceae bacterium]|jgi:hypothetical protein
MNIKLSKAHKLSRRMKFRGLDISIETDKGELRHWYDPHNDTKGSTKMIYPYGYIRRTKGVDGDHVDVYVGPNENAPNVYIVNQMKAPDFRKFDENKCLIGFNNAKDAKAAYLKHYNNRKFFGSMTTMPWSAFEKKVKATFDKPKKIAMLQKGDFVMTPLQKAYAFGKYIAEETFKKTSEAALGDPNYWQGGTPTPGETPTPAQTAEEAVQLLPAGTFQGAQIKITPDGQRNTTVKVTPDAVAQPDALANVFNAEPNAKIEISQAETQGANEELLPTPYPNQ